MGELTTLQVSSNSTEELKLRAERVFGEKLKFCSMEIVVIAGAWTVFWEIKLGWWLLRHVRLVKYRYNTISCPPSMHKTTLGLELAHYASMATD